jgi:hypothetical protein
MSTSVSPCLPLANVNPWRTMQFTATYKTVTTKPDHTKTLSVPEWYTDKSLNPRAGTSSPGAFPISCGDAASCLPSWRMWLYSSKYSPRDTLPQVGADSPFEQAFRKRLFELKDDLWVSLGDLLNGFGDVPTIRDLATTARSSVKGADVNLHEVQKIYRAFAGWGPEDENVKYSFIDTSSGHPHPPVIVKSMPLDGPDMTPMNLWALSKSNGGPYFEIIGNSPDDVPGMPVPFYMKVNNARAEIMNRVYSAAKQIQCAQYLRDYCTKWLSAKHIYDQQHNKMQVK